MYCGLPIIANNIPGQKELVVHKKTGLLFEVDSRKSTFRELQTMASITSEERAIMGSHACNRVVIEREIDLMARKFLAPNGHEV